jgi:hypothetical protein
MAPFSRRKGRAWLREKALRLGGIHLRDIRAVRWKSTNLLCLFKWRLRRNWRLYYTEDGDRIVIRAGLRGRMLLPLADNARENLALD